MFFAIPESMVDSPAFRIVLFDGVCEFCNASVNFIIRRDPKSVFRFAPLQSEIGQKYLKEFRLESTDLTSMVLIEGGLAYVRSTAGLRIARKLSGLWPLMYVFILVPPFLRNSVYNLVAKNRYRWWGKRDECMIPTPDVKSRFLS